MKNINALRWLSLYIDRCEQGRTITMSRGKRSRPQYVIFDMLSKYLGSEIIKIFQRGWIIHGNDVRYMTVPTVAYLMGYVETHHLPSLQYQNTDAEKKYSEMITPKSSYQLPKNIDYSLATNILWPDWPNIITTDNRENFLKQIVSEIMGIPMK